MTGCDRGGELAAAKASILTAQQQQRQIPCRPLPTGDAEALSRIVHEAPLASRTPPTGDIAVQVDIFKEILVPVVGGLGIFMLGLEFMSDGIDNLAVNRMRLMLAKIAVFALVYVFSKVEKTKNLALALMGFSLISTA
jgi:hypothetical protein